MTCKTENKTINGASLTVTQFPPSISIPLKFRILKLVNKSLTGLIDLVGEVNMEEPTPEDIAKIMGIIGELFERCDPQGVYDLIVDTVQDSFYKDQRVSKETIDTLFSGKMEDLYLLAAFSVSVNYGDFIKGLMPK